MREFKEKGNTSNKDLVNHILHNFPEEYGIILDTFWNWLTSSGSNTLTIQVICKKLNQWCEKNKTKMIAYGKPYWGMCTKFKNMVTYQLT